jgi:predicted nucleic acid-binding protein
VFLFDTDTLSNLGKSRPSPRLLRQLAAAPGPIYTSAITVAEMLKGAHKSPHPALFIQKFRDAIQQMSGVLPFDRQAAEIYGTIAAEVERQEVTIGFPDLQIAAIALCRGLTVVTHNIGHFQRVPGSQVADWL